MPHVCISAHALLVSFADGVLASVGNRFNLCKWLIFNKINCIAKKMSDIVSHKAGAGHLKADSGHFHSHARMGVMIMMIRTSLALIPFLALAVACGGETPPAEAPEGASAEEAAPEAAEEPMGDTADEGMADEAAEEGTEEPAAEEGTEEPAAEEGAAEEPAAE